MLDWLKRRMAPAIVAHEVDIEPPDPPRRAMTGKYRLLYKYLDERYADTVVLTFAEIEDLLGFALPDQARSSERWWTDEDGRVDSDYSDSWILARRTAAPNLRAGTVAFERRS
jgi:hypothetical protein